MNARICSIEGCEKPLRNKSRALCSMHYQRWRKHGDPLAGNVVYAIPEESFTARVAWDGEHLIWTGTLSAAGYGQLSVNGRRDYAHRYAWEREHGPIPEGMVIDHRCWVRSCVNVDHLRLATVAQNCQNLSGATSANTTTGVRGVSPTANGRRYQAKVKHNGIPHYCGTFDTIGEAASAAAAKRAELFGEYAGRP